MVMSSRLYDGERKCIDACFELGRIKRRKLRGQDQQECSRSYGRSCCGKLVTWVIQKVDDSVSELHEQMCGSVFERVQ
jgi:hypothetical protein